MQRQHSNCKFYTDLQVQVAYKNDTRDATEEHVTSLIPAAEHYKY